jgi:NitT/TauT family transport system substrate-binding protein
MIHKEDKIAEIITRYPFIKEKLISRNKRFEKLNNPAVFNTVGKYARIMDIAKVGGEDLEELLDFLNSELNSAHDLS